jgi:hypothetical protein
MFLVLSLGFPYCSFSKVQASCDFPLGLTPIPGMSTKLIRIEDIATLLQRRYSKRVGERECRGVGVDVGDATVESGIGEAVMDGVVGSGGTLILFSQ